MQIYSPEVYHGSTSLPVTRRSEGIKPLCAFTHQNPNKTSANKRWEYKGEDYQEVSGYPEKITDLRVMKNIWEISPPLWQHPEVIYLSGIVTHGEWGAPNFKLGKANFRKNGTFASEMPIGSGLSARCKLSSVYAQITPRRRLYAVISYLFLITGFVLWCVWAEDSFLPHRAADLSKTQGLSHFFQNLPETPGGCHLRRAALHLWYRTDQRHQSRSHLDLQQRSHQGAFPLQVAGK